MAEKWTFDVNPPIFTFSNEQVTFAVETNVDVLPPEPPVTVESVTLTTPHDTTHHGNTVDLGITGVEVPLPVIEHLSGHFFDLG
jgi:hypothetical protein